jgi:hypothetical protein
MRLRSPDEFAVLMSVHAGISPARYQAITEIDFVVTEDGDIHGLEWSQSQRLHFLLLAALNYGRYH